MAVELPILSRFAFDLWAFFKWKSNGIRTPALVGLIGGPPRRDRGSSHARCVPFAYPRTCRRAGCVPTAYQGQTRNAAFDAASLQQLIAAARLPNSGISEVAVYSRHQRSWTGSSNWGEYCG